MSDPVIAHAYLILIPLAILEGPLLAIACGVGAGLGYLNPLLAYGILILGDVIPDNMYYWIGRYGATLTWVRRTAARTHLIRRHFISLERLWRERPLTTLSAAKLSYGLTPPLVVSAGLSGVPYSRFASASLFIGAIYLGMLGAVGYVLSHAYGYINVSTGNAGFYVGIAGFACFCFLLSVMYHAHRHISRESREQGIAESYLISKEDIPKGAD
ncbi:MAG: hypothetical protein KGJ34_00375 [Patescibacteria group bacterium]|nr:hypothetical protein [Patescibacteria group bacterium]